MVKLEHLIKQVEGFGVVNFADIAPRNLLLLHLIRNQATVAVLKRNLLDCIAAEDTHKRNKVADGEVLDLAAVVERKDRVALRDEREKDNSTGPYIDCTSLILVQEESLRRHVAFCPSAISYLHLPLELRDPLHLRVVGVFARLLSLVVDLQF
jgi:hypothetical protein